MAFGDPARASGDRNGDETGTRTHLETGTRTHLVFTGHRLSEGRPLIGTRPT
jgi:hypothetical protein